MPRVLRQPASVLGRGAPPFLTLLTEVIPSAVPRNLCTCDLPSQVMPGNAGCPCASAEQHCHGSSNPCAVNRSRLESHKSTQMLTQMLRRLSHPWLWELRPCDMSEQAAKDSLDHQVLLTSNTRIGTRRPKGKTSSDPQRLQEKRRIRQSSRASTGTPPIAGSP